MQQPEQKNKQTIAWAMVVVLGLATAMFGYLFTTQKSELTQQESLVVEKARELALTKTKLDSISAQLDIKIAEIQQLGGSVDSLVALKAQLERDKQELKNVNNFATTNYNKKIKSYEAVLNQKDSEIAQLKQELGIVTSKNEELNQQVTGLESERTRLSDSVNSYSSMNRELSEKVS